MEMKLKCPRLYLYYSKIGKHQNLIFCFQGTLVMEYPKFCYRYVVQPSLYKRNELKIHQNTQGGGVAQWLGRWISDQGVPSSNPGRCTFRCGLEQVTLTLLSTG